VIIETSTTQPPGRELATVAEAGTGTLFVGSSETIARTTELVDREGAPRVQHLLTKEPRTYLRPVAAGGRLSQGLALTG
jgi:hypothetical protein